MFGLTVGQSFDARLNNFDIIRLCAAALVIFSHSFSLLGYREPVAYWLGNYDTGGGWAVSIFFVISGFLIARSCLQRSLPVYFSARVTRLIPALSMLLVFDVLIVGPVFTTLPLSEYFTSSNTFRHFGSVSLFYQSTSLPGVFDGGAVNGTIWTLPLEFACYMLLPIIAAITCLRRWVVLIPLMMIAGLYAQAIHSGLDWANQGGDIFVGLPYFSTLKNTLFFMIGATMWVHRDDIPLSTPLAVLAILVLVSGSYGYAKTFSFYVGLSYLTIYISVANHIPINLQKWPGDLSYGTYLYGFPVQQALIYSPLRDHLSPFILTALALPITLILAYALNRAGFAGGSNF